MCKEFTQQRSYCQSEQFHLSLQWRFISCSFLCDWVLSPSLTRPLDCRQSDIPSASAFAPPQSRQKETMTCRFSNILHLCQAILSKSIIIIILLSFKMMEIISINIFQVKKFQHLVKAPLKLMKEDEILFYHLKTVFDWCCIWVLPHLRTTALFFHLWV